tara:strand:- start:28 stop:861 length:834 start_codon:yes stop_codon:yes gene_type:complete
MYMTKLDITKIPLDDQKTWDLICSGNTKGVFQLETHLGKHWCKECQPRTIEELSDVISIIRPGTLKSKQDNKSMTQHYADRKSGKDEVGSLYGPIDSVTSKTYNVIIYQEQAMQIAQVMAGFSEQQADSLRKAIGKKLADLMAEVRTEFLEGCDKNGHSKEDSERIFDIIEKSNRYSFNKSLTLDTLVETESGEMVTIEDVPIGTKIKTPDGYATVKDKYDHGEQDVFEVTIGDNKIKCTITHKFLGEDGAISPLWSFLFTGRSILNRGVANAPTNP